MSIATITTSEKAPKGVDIEFGFTNADGEYVNVPLGGKNKPFATDDLTLIANAKVHPWLVVNEELPAEVVVDSVDAPSTSVAIDAGLNQNIPTTIDDAVATTLAAPISVDPPFVPAAPEPPKVAEQVADTDADTNTKKKA